jgi:hypothetical protein
MGDPIVEVKLYDVTGKLLQDLPLPGGGQISVRLNTAVLPRGVYIVRVQTTTGIFQQKLSKQ